MKVYLLAFLISFQCFSQSKEQLIESIIKHNVYESEQTGYSGSPSKQYENFMQLTQLLSKEEMAQLTNHKNGVLRTYATTYLIKEKDTDPTLLFSNEVNRNETIKTLRGCLGGNDRTSDIIYYSYWNKIRTEAAKGISYELNDLVEEAENKKVKTDVKMKEMDSIIVSGSDKVGWLLYVQAFENNNFEKTLMPKIEKLGFQQNNPYALGYLISNYPDLYKVSVYNYYKEEFTKLKFTDSEESTMYFHEFLELLLKTGDKKIQQIAVNAVKRSSHVKSTWFKNTFEDYNIKL